MFFILFLLLSNLFIYKLDAKVQINRLIALNNPWSITFIDKDNLLITEKKGNIKLYNIKEKKIYKISHNLNVYNAGQGGLLDIVYRDNFIWITYSEKLKHSFSRTSIAKSQFNTKTLNFKNIFEAYPPINSGYHFGARLVLKEDYIFASLGERGKGMISQDGMKHPGSIIRIFNDGRVPSNNPGLVNKINWLPEIYQIGLRNPQGLELSPFNKKIYVTNHGAKGGDFFGEVLYGGNYGWKLLGWGGKNYIGTKIGPKWKEGYDKPIYYWTPSIGISSFIIYKGIEFSELNGMAIIGSLKYENLYALNFLDVKEKPQNIILVEGKLGRIRDIEIHPNNGKIYLINSENLWRLEK